MVFEQGAQPSELVLVLRGNVGLQTIANGKAHQTAFFNRSGSVLLQQDVLLRRPYEYRAVALVDGTQVLFIPEHVCDELKTQDGSFAQYLMNDLALKNAELSEYSSIIRDQHVILKVSRQLLWLWERAGSLQFTQNEIAEMLGIARISVAKAITTLKAKGFLTGRGKSSSIPNAAALVRYVETYQGSLER